MILMFCRNRVADFVTWKRIFDSHAEAHHHAGLRLIHLGRSLDEATSVFFLFEVHDLEKARAFVTTPGNERIAEAAGVVDGGIHFVETP